MSFTPPDLPGLSRNLITDRSKRRDAIFVSSVVAVSVVSSIVVTIILTGPFLEALIPAVVIPLCVSLPVSLYLVRLRRRIEMLNGQLIELARRDQLTGLLNRGAFAADIAASRSGGVVVLVDVDWFKSINDRFGHQAGDLVLQEIAAHVTRALPPEAIIGRLGGEEFCIFLPGRDLDEGAAEADALRVSIAKRDFVHEGRAIELTISAGVSELEEADALDTAVRLADRALYRAKGEGRNLVRRGHPEES